MSKANACLNGEWGKHVKKFQKKQTSKLRRLDGKKECCKP